MNGEWGYRRPASLSDLASAVLDAEDVLLMGGGTDLVPAIKRGTVRPTTLVSTLAASELEGIYEEAAGVAVGAAVCLDAFARSPLVAERYPALVDAASTLASRQIRNRGTVGGNLCLDTRCDYYNKSVFWRKEYPDCRKAGGETCYVVPRGTGCHALHSGDLAPAFIAYRAEIEVLSTGGEKARLPLEDLYSDSGLHSTVLQQGDMLLRVVLPSSVGTTAVFLRWAPRETIDFPTVTIAAVVGSDWGRFVVGHVLPFPKRVVAVEEPMRRFVAGGGHTAEATEEEIAQAVVGSLDMKSAHRGAVWHKKIVIRALTKRALDALRSDAQGLRTEEGGA